MNPQEPPLTQDEDVRRAWRAASDESPPFRVDAAILAAARDATGRPGPANGVKRIRPWYREWQPMLAAAAVAGLAFALVQTMPRDAREAIPPGTPAPSGARSESAELAKAQEREEPPGSAELAARRETHPASSDEAPALAEPDAGSANAGAQAEARIADKSVAGIEPRSTPPAPAVASAPAPAAAPGASDSLMSMPPPAAAKRERADAPTAHEKVEAVQQAGAVEPSVDARIERIVALYRSGDRSGAAAELRALRVDAEGIDGRLPPDLRAWARTVH